MNFKRLLLFLAAPLALVMSSCEEEGPIYSTPKITITDASGAEVTALNFDAEVGTQTITITANHSWTASENAEWLSVTPASDNNTTMLDRTVEVQIKVVPNDGAARNETIKITMDKIEKNILVQQAGEGQTALGDVLYYDNFDKGGKQAQKGSSGWNTYLDGAGAEFLNPTPESQANVVYEGTKVTVRSNTANGSAGEHSNCADVASGVNYIWFGTAPTNMTVSGISLAALEGNALTLSFTTERYVYEAPDNTYNKDDFKVYISGDNEKWTEVDYNFLDGVNLNGKWNIATAQFNLKEVPETLSIYMTASVGSAYAIDDLKLTAGGGGAEIDLAAGTTIDGAGSGEGGGSGSGDGGNDDIVTESDPNAQQITVAEFIEKADTATTYQLTGTIVGPINTTFGNFDLEDESGKIYVYGLIDGTTGTNLDWAAKGLNEGDIITVQGKYYLYSGSNGDKHEIVNALYISHTTNNTPRITSVSPEAMTFTADGGTKEITVNTAGEGGTLAATTEAGWLTVTVANGAVSVVAEANAGEAREATITVTYGEDSATVTVSQAAPIVAGSEVNATITFDDTAKRSVYTTSQQVWEENGITVTNNKAGSTSNIGDYSKPVRFYKSAEVIVSVAGTITKLVFHINSYDAKYLTAMTDSVEGETVDGNAVAITLDGTSSSYTFTTANQVRVDSIDVTYIAGEGSGDQGGEEPEPEDPEDPETPVELAGTGEGTLESPYDVTRAKAAIDAYTTVSGAYVKGIVTTTAPAFNSQYSSCDYYISVDGTTDNELMVYSGKFVDGANFTSADQIHAGDEVVVCGDLKLFNGTYEFNYSSKIVSLVCNHETTEEPETPEEPSVVKVTVEEFKAAAEDATIYELTGTIKGTYNTVYGNFYLEDATGEVLIYGIYKDGEKCYESLGLVDGDTVTVQGARASYNDAAQMKNAEYVSHVVNTTPRILSIDATSLNYAADGDEKTVKVTTAGEGGSLAAATEADWLTVRAADGVVTVVAAANTGDAREATITVTYGESTETVTVKQGAYVPEGVVAWYSETWTNATSHANEYKNGTISGDLGTWTYDGCSTYDEAQFGSKVGLALGKTADIKESAHTAPIIVSPTFENGIQGIKFNYYANNAARKVVINVYENGTLSSTHTVTCAAKNTLTAAEITVTTTGSTYFEFVGDGTRRFSIGDIQVKY